MSDPFAPSDALRMARQWIESGQPSRALANLTRRLEEAGADDRPSALRDLGWAEWWVEKPERAVELFQQALAAIPDSVPDRTIAYLTARDLGLGRASLLQFEPALSALERASAEEARLGVPPPPARPLLLARAEISLYANKPRIAQEMARTALETLSNDSPHVPFAMVIAAEARTILGEVPWEPFLGDLKSQLEAIVAILEERTAQGDPSVLRQVAADLADLPSRSGKDDLVLRISLLNTLAKLDGLCKDQAGRADTLSRLSAAYGEAKDGAGRAWADLEWSKSMIDLNRFDQAGPMLDGLETIPPTEHNLRFLAALTRQRGRFFAAQGQFDPAREAFRKAIHLARQAGDEGETGRAEIVFGIHLQHGGEVQEAMRWIDLGLEKLNPDDDHARAAMRHRECLIDNVPCPCKQGKAS